MINFCCRCLPDNVLCRSVYRQQSYVPLVICDAGALFSLLFNSTFALHVSDFQTDLFV